MLVKHRGIAHRIGRRRGARLAVGATCRWPRRRRRRLRRASSVASYVPGSSRVEASSELALAEPGRDHRVPAHDGLVVRVVAVHDVLAEQVSDRGRS